MDRLRKRLQQLQVKVRAFVKYNWHNEPEGDRFRSLEILYVLGAVRYKPTAKWQRICWNAYCVTSVFSLLILVLNAIDTIQEPFDLAKVTWHASVTLAACLLFVRVSVLNQHFESIQTAQKFINGKPFASGDSLIQIISDSVRRKKCFQRLQLALLVIFSMTLFNYAIVYASSSGIDEFFGAPQIIQFFGPTVAGTIHFLFLLTLFPLWLNKYCAIPGTICSLLYDFNTEYEIFVRGFDNILDNVYSDVEEELSSSVKGGAPEWKRFQRDQLYWKYLEKRVNDQVKLHVQFVKNLQLLKPVVKILFGIIYYNAMVLCSPVIYVLMTNGLTGATIIMVTGLASPLLECYMWCQIIDSLKDTNEKLELKIMELATNIPFSQFHHKKYAEMRTTLCIMKTFVRNHEPFSCGGVFPISVEAFTDLLNIGYKVFTFLRDMGKKNNVQTRHRSLKRQRNH